MGDKPFENLGWTNHSLEMTFADVDPEGLGLLTGGVMGTAPEPTFSMDIVSRNPVKRTFWQWLRRRPVEYTYSRTFFPNVKMADPDE